jgi:hypothetical protein
MALGIIFAPDLTLEYVSQVYTIIKQSLGLDNAAQQLQNNFMQTVEGGLNVIRNR